MPATRGKQGAVLDVPAARVQELMAAAARRISEGGAQGHGQGRPGAFFTRLWLRDFFDAQEDVSAQAAEAMVHAFWRTVHPTPLAGMAGWHLLSDYAEHAIRHRDWRITSGQLSLPDVIALHKLLAGQKELEPGLAELRSRMDRALRSLRIPVTLWR